MGVFNGFEINDIIPGTEGDDTIEGNGGNDTLNGEHDALSPVSAGLGNDDVGGGIGHDVLYAGDILVEFPSEDLPRGALTLSDAERITSDDDVLFGDEDDDLLIGGPGFDGYDGGDGFDTLDFSRARIVVAFPLSPESYGLPWYFEGVRVDLAAGEAVSAGLTGSIGDSEYRLTLEGGFAFHHRTILGIESVVGTRGADTLVGSDNGDDQIERFQGLGGDDILNGKGGFDEVSYHTERGDSGIVFDFAGPVTDTFGDTDAVRGMESVRGSRHGDLLVGTAADERFRPHAGNDTVRGGNGLDFVDCSGDERTPGPAGAAEAGIIVDLDDETATDGYGDTDTLESIERIRGGSFADDVSGTDGPDILEGGGGDDTLDGRGGDDLLGGGDGADLLSGGGDDDILFGSAGGDTLRGGAGQDNLSGDDGDDVLEGGGQGDAMDGGGQNDTLKGGGGNDTLEGAGGRDSLAGGGGKDTLRGGTQADTLEGGAKNDDLAGGAGVDSLDGGGGADRLDGGADRDLMDGGGGHDVLVAGGGNDEMKGGRGTDVLTASAGATGGIRVDLEAGEITGGGFGVNVLAGIESVFATDFADRLRGNDADNLLIASRDRDLVFGFDGDDTLQGGAGNDRLFGNADDDVLHGDRDDTAVSEGRGADLLDGGGGNDRLLGGPGEDTLRGGGADTFLGGSDDDLLIGGGAADVFVISTGNDRVRDFDDNTDKVDMSGLGSDVEGLRLFTNFAQIQRAVRDIDGDTVINLGGGSSLTLEGVLFDELRATDFLYAV